VFHLIAFLGDTVSEDAAGRVLGSGLRDQGESVVLGAFGTRSDEADETDDGLLTTAGTDPSGDDVDDLLVRAEEAVGQLHAVVLVLAGPSAMTAGDLAGLDPTRWRQSVEVPLEQTLACFQGAYRRLRTCGGGLVVLVPTLALVGAPGFVPWATVAEGQRSLAKAAARAWGREGITVNCVAVRGSLLRSPGDDPPDRPGQPPPSLGPLPGLRLDVAPVVSALVSGGWAAVTGATIAVDGGVWMTP
jgi:NAD(P)-dependent dehydrogenase (short-subunit alcohol dehydrogenase family)